MDTRTRRPWSKSSGIRALFYDKTRDDLDIALQKLAGLKVALFKSYTGAWSVFEGSDFDIDAAIAQALAASPGVDYARLAQLMGLHPVVAKRHYHETGSMRWMELSLCSIEQAEKVAADFRPKKGEFGTFSRGPYWRTGPADRVWGDGGH